MIEITINGSARFIRDHTNLADLTNDLQVPIRGVAIAVNGEVIPKSRWPEFELGSNDKLELLTISQGG